MGDEKEYSELEKQFIEAQKEAVEKINEQLNVASRALAKAEKISEKYGIPFSSGVSPVGNTYTPEAFEKKFGDLDRDFIGEITDWSSCPGEYSGWEYSAAC